MDDDVGCTADILQYLVVGMSATDNEDNDGDVNAVLSFQYLDVIMCRQSDDGIVIMIMTLVTGA